MKIQKEIEVRLTKKRSPGAIHVVQYDKGVQLVFNILDFDLPSGTTATLYVRKKSGKFVYQEDGITVSGNTVTVNLENQALTEHGEAFCQLELLNGSDTLSTFASLMMVEKSYKDADATESKTVIRAFEEKTAEQIAEIKAAGNEQIALVRQAAETEMGAKAPPIICEAEGTEIAVADASNEFLCALFVYGKSTQSGTPTPDTPVDIASISNPTVTVGDQIITISRTIPGIPVESGGNYTDANGQQWICDEVNLESGVYVQRVYRGQAAELDWNVESTTETFNEYLAFLNELRFVNGFLYSTHFAKMTDNRMVAGSNRLLYARFPVSTGINTAEKANEFMRMNDVLYLAVLLTPIETSLTDKEINAFKALHSNYPNTVIQNDAGAWMKVKYVADTKTYIDNKIAQLGGSV